MRIVNLIMININSLYNSNFIQLFLTMYMTPYKNFYYYIIGCLNHFFFLREKETLHQRKSAARLGRLRLQGALAPRSFHHEAWLHDEMSVGERPLEPSGDLSEQHFFFGEAFLFLARKRNGSNTIIM